jgi:hypothetical protein
LDQSTKFRAIVDDLERQRPNLIGKPLAAVPELAAVRLHYRRGFYRWANINFGASIFNVVIATSSLSWFWALNALAAGVSFWAAVFSERRARAMSRQLNRPAIEQIARDLMGNLE